MKNRINADQEKTRDFHQYTVGEMAALLSMSAPTIRFYDSQGAVVPHRDEENQYRKYTVVDGNYLIKMKELKNIGASLQESVQLLNDVDLTGYCDGFRQLEQAEQKRIERQQLLLQGFQRKITLIESLETELNQITLGMQPALWRMDHQIEDQFRAQKAAVTARANWTDWMPAADLSFLFSAGDPEHALHWGFAMEAPLAEALELDKQDSVYYPAVPCVRMVFCTHNEVFLRYENLQPALSYLEKHAFALAGDILGRSIARVMGKENTIIHYYDVWLPIKDREIL